MSLSCHGEVLTSRCCFSAAAAPGTPCQYSCIQHETLKAPSCKCTSRVYRRTFLAAASLMMVGGSWRWSPARMARGAFSKALHVAASSACTKQVSCHRWKRRCGIVSKG